MNLAGSVIETDEETVIIHVVQSRRYVPHQAHQEERDLKDGVG